VAKEFPERPDFRAHVAFEMAKADRLEETIAAFAKIAEAPSHWPDYRPQLARRLEGVGEPGAAALIYRQLLADYPQVPEYRSALARCLTATGRREEAEAILKQSPPAQKPKPAPAEKKKAKQSGKPKAES
jgi:tetratricopeptide (TPR) repeat protein